MPLVSFQNPPFPRLLGITYIRTPTQDAPKSTPDCVLSDPVDMTSPEGHEPYKESSLPQHLGHRD